MKIALAALLLVATAATAHAHERSASYSRWDLDPDGASVQVRLPARAATALAGAPAEVLPEALRLERGGAACVPDRFTRLATEPGWLAAEWRVDCPRTGALRLRGQLVPALAGHVHLATVRDGDRTVEVVLAGDDAGAAIDPGPAPARAGRFLVLGVEHILGGWDHLLFLLTLIVCARRMRELAVVVTGFTAGHSLTLALAATGVVVPQAASVEALIGASIALVAVENLWLAGDRRDRVLPVGAVAALVVAAVAIPAAGVVPIAALAGLAVAAACYLALVARAADPAPMRGAAAALFGLIHGFGFAAVLTGSGGGVPLLPLAAFNLGVELGQLAVVALVWPLVFLARRAGQQGAVVRVASTAALAIGVMWFVQRALGG